MHHLHLQNIRITSRLWQFQRYHYLQLHCTSSSIYLLLILYLFTTTILICLNAAPTVVTRGGVGGPNITNKVIKLRNRWWWGRGNALVTNACLSKRAVGRTTSLRQILLKKASVTQGYSLLYYRLSQKQRAIMGRVDSVSSILGGGGQGSNKVQKSSGDDKISSSPVKNESIEEQMALDNKLQQSLSSSSTTILLHFCFLVHGWLGNDKEMSYIEEALERASKQYLLIGNSKADKLQQSHNHQPIIAVCKPTCNVGKTNDGIANGGDRLAEEIINYVKKRTRFEVLERYGINGSGEVVHDDDDDGRLKNDDPAEVTISFVGNSLGGLYARYAIAKLMEEPITEKGIKNGFVITSSDGYSCIKAHFNVFCTTATPHLGVSRHTFLGIPRFAETLIGAFLGETGRDLFRSSSLLRDMAIDPMYRNALASFPSRIAYANAFMTDFQVPTKTAAFICSDSTYPHHLDKIAMENVPDDIKHIFVAMMHTDAMDYDDAISSHSLCTEEMAEPLRDQIDMSIALDSIGWKKVFIDARSLVPLSISVPFLQDVAGALDKWRDQTVVESREVVDMLTGSNQISAPFGHTVMIANAKDGFNIWLNSKGMPVSDQLAKDLIQEMWNWSE